MKDFIQIKYNFFNFNNNHITPLYTIETGGFLLYHYLLYQQNNRITCTVTIRMIQKFLNRDYNNRPIITYNKNKKNAISLLKSKNTIIKYLYILSNNGFVKLYDKIPNNINEPITIQCIKDNTNGFEAFSSELFVDYIHKIGHIGFTILCILGKCFNRNYGSCSCEGFANPTEEYISNIINRDLKTVRAYLYLLQDLKLINIISQDPIITGYNQYGEAIYKYIPNHYEVKYKMNNNKYNVKD